MTLGDLRALLANFEGAPDSVTLVGMHPETGRLVDLDLSGEVVWRDAKNKFTTADDKEGEKVFLVHFSA
jgi:hypothetical protein